MAAGGDEPPKTIYDFADHLWEKSIKSDIQKIQDDALKFLDAESRAQCLMTILGRRMLDIMVPPLSEAAIASRQKRRATFIDSDTKEQVKTYKSNLVGALSQEELQKQLEGLKAHLDKKEPIYASKVIQDLLYGDPIEILIAALLSEDIEARAKIVAHDILIDCALQTENDIEKLNQHMQKL